MAYRMVPGREPDLRSRGRALLWASAEQPGFLGGGVLVDGEVWWHVVYRFDCEGSARDGDNSVTRIQWSARADELARGTGRRTVRGSTAWCDSGTVTSPATEMETVVSQYEHGFPAGTSL
ncbi:hypothetical protein [Streptomyces avermitilis]|uniref:hypothetical protein n=1 Tax=Streptomyces avermitilis TaxID=33903 RepID=UPI0033B88780